MGICLKIKTPRYNFSATLSHKMNVVIGDSGKGKTTLLNLLTGNSSNVSIDISEGYDVEILNESVFKRIIKKIERFYKMNDTELPGRRTPEDSKQRDKMLMDYWKSSTNFDFFDSVIFIDDEDFVRGNDFACMFNSDTSNCYVVFGRGKLSQIGVHMDAIYNFETTGVEHFLVPSLDYEEFHRRPVNDVLVEGVGSDFKFLSLLLSDCNVGSLAGRGNFSNIIQKLNNKTVYLFVDKCVFGMNYLFTNKVCQENGIKVLFAEGYESFEYFLLKSNFFNLDVELYKEQNFLKVFSEEVLFEQKLKEMTKGTRMSYTKNIKEFSKCYTDDCCPYTYTQANTCRYFREDKSAKMLFLLKGTCFEYLLSNTIVNTPKIQQSNFFK